MKNYVIPTLVLIGLAFLLFITPFLIMWTWNFVIVSVFGVGEVDIFQAMGLWVVYLVLRSIFVK